MKILVTHKIPFYDEVVNPIKDQVVLGKLRDLDESFDGLLCLLTDKITKEVLDKGKNLKIIANYAVGFDNIDVEECKKRNIAVTNTPCDEVNEAVAEFTWSLILALARQLEPAANFAKNVGYRGWEPDIFVGTDLKGKTLGVIGSGRIGGLVASKGVAFQMKVLTHSRSAGTDLQDIISQSDIISLHVPLTPETHHLINSKTNFKPGSFLVNTARGPVVDEADLLELLKNGILAGAALDVWENEPYPRPELVEMSNVILTPHIASATKSARMAMGKTAVANLIAFSSGQTPPNLI
jgi:glyoxylate reductase